MVKKKKKRENGERRKILIDIIICGWAAYIM